MAKQVQTVQKVYIEWCVKAGEIILDARLNPHDAVEPPLQASASFGLTVPEIWNVRSEAVARPEFFQVKTQRSFQIEIFLGPEGEMATEESGRLLERWTFAFFPTQQEPVASDRCNQTLVRKLSVTLRSLLCFTKLLPAYRVCRGPRPAVGRRWHRFRVEAWPPTSRTPAQEMLTQDFASFHSTVGTMRLSVSHWKDLNSLSMRPERALAGGSTVELIEMDEGYVAGSETRVLTGSKSDGMQASPRSVMLGKKPKARRSTVGVMLGPQSSTSDSVDHLPASCASDITAVHSRVRSRTTSEASEASTISRAASTSSRGQPLIDHSVMHSSTPPVPAPGTISLGPQRSETPSSSRSATPHTTPQLGPQPDPKHICVGSRQTSPVSSTYVGEAHRGNTASPNLVASLGSSQSGIGSASISSRIGRADEITESWMNSVPEWARRSSVSSRGSAHSGRPSPRSGIDTGPPSRVLSPELDNVEGRRTPTIQDDEAPYAAAGDFRMVGMPSDDEKEAPEEEAATIEVRSSLAETPDKRLSPLIAQLNPFLSPPPLELPEAEDLGNALDESRDIGDTCGLVLDGLEDTSDAHPLLSEMRDLIYRMHKCQLSLALKEVHTEDMLARLAHFKEFASEQ